MLKPISPSSPRRNHQSGLTLIESLISLFVLAIGLLGLAGMQARLLAENRTSNQRAVAIGLIDDLANRMIVNRDAAIAGNYALAWGASKNSQDCITNSCTGSQMAQSDLNIWRANVAAALPGADVTVFASATDSRQIGIAVAWSSNEGAAASDSAYTSPFAVTTATKGVNCPANSICHVVYVQP